MKPLASLLFCLLFAGCVLKPQPDPAAAARHAAAGAKLVKKHLYAEAEKEYTQALALAPGRPAYALELGELREALEQYPGARRAYREGLDGATADEPLRQDLVWRLALLEALHLDDPAAARKLSGELAGSDFRALDLDGVLRLCRGDLGDALQRFDQARARAGTPELEAFPLYHASLAYWRQHNTKEAFSTLFLAINQATAPGLIKDIENHFKVINHP